jgi:NTP pyrophosphatase (non-canonical NTP hydrolase)
MSYQKKALRTEPSYEAPQSRLNNPSTTRLVHAAMGLQTEAGELTDALKRHIFYGKELDRTNLKEEAGDLCWYLAILAEELGTTLEELQELNIKKLQARFPNKFTEEDATTRDLETERQVLEELPERFF